VIYAPLLKTWQYVYFGVVMAFDMGAQILAEALFKAMGGGVSDASSIFTTAPFLLLPTIFLLFISFVQRGVYRLLRMTGYAIALHAVACGWVWFNIATPTDPDPGLHSLWINQHPQPAGIILMIVAAAACLAILSTSELFRLPKTDGRIEEDPI